jgi:hypothetical protein
MKAKRLGLALALLLLLALAPQPAKASPGVWVMYEKTLTTNDNGETKTFSTSGGGSVELGGGYGAVVEAYVAPARAQAELLRVDLQGLLEGGAYQRAAGEHRARTARG